MTAVVDRRGGGAPVGRDTIGRRSVAASSGALRLAWREVRRAKARTALVVMLIAVPIGAMAFASVITRSVNLTERQRAMVALGSVADARFASFGSADAAALPLADAVHADVTRAYVGPVRLGPGAHDASVIVADLASPLLRGAYDLTAGYAPLTADEAAISVAAARKYHVGVGDRVALLRTGQEWAVSGVYRDADQVGEVAIVVARMPSGVRPTDVYRYVTADTDALRAVLATASTVTAVRNPGLPQPFDAGGKTFLLPLLGIYAMGIVGLFVTGTVVSAAFAAGARRQLRTMGLVAASGGSPAFVCTVLVAQGLVCGVLGALVGLAASAAGVAIIAPHVDRLVGFVLPGLHSRASDLAIIALLAIAASAAAAAIPAVGLGRVPVLSALAGRRPARQPSSAVPVIGLVLFGLGLVGVAVSAGLPYTGYGALQLALYSGASLAMLVGAVLAAPWLVGRLETASIGARGALRVAARTMARSRNRTGPIAAAILVTVGLATIIGVYHAATISYADATESAGGDPRAIVITTSYDAPRGAVGFPGLRPSAATAPKTVASVVAVAPDATVFPTRTVVTPAEQAGAGYGDSWLVVPLGTVTGPAATIERAGQPIASDRGALTAIGVPTDDLTAWERGSALVLGAGLVSNGQLTLLHLVSDPAANATTADRSEVVPARELPALVRSTWVDGGTCDAQRVCSGLAAVPIVVLPNQVITRLGLVASAESTTIVRARQPLSRDQRAALRQLNRDLADASAATADSVGPTAQTYLSFVDDVGPAQFWQVILLAASMFAALGVTAVGLSLSAAEARADDATFLALGAPPRFRRSVRAWEALLTTATGSVVGVPLGVLVGAVFRRSSRRDPGRYVHLHMPWQTLLALGAGLPLAAAAVFWLCIWPRRAVLLRND